MKAPTALAWACVMAVLILQALWQLLRPSPSLPPAAGWLLSYLPLLPLLLAWIFGLRHALIYAGIGMLIWFCHGVMEAWVNPQVRGLALLEALLCVAYFAALAWRRAVSRSAQARLREQS